MAKYKIADILLEMNTFGRTKKQAAAYLSDSQEPVDFVIPSNRQDIIEKHPDLSEDDCEYIATGGFFYRSLTLYEGILLHSSCVVVDDRAYLFTAPSGTGKSTHTALWLKLFGDRAYILNDDKPAIRVLGDKVFVYGTPWSGKNDCQRNACVELGGIAVLRRAKENSMRKIDSVMGIYELLSQTARTVSVESMEKCMDTIGKILVTGKVFELFCNMDISAAKLSYETMSEKRICYED